MRKILAMIAKELSHLKRDKRSLMIMFFMPVLELAVLGYASNMDITSLAMVVVDRDHSSSSRALVDDFLATEYFVLAGREQDLDAIDREIDRGRAVMALVIPVDFEKGLLQGRGAQVEAIFDGSESYTANAGIGYASIIVARYSRNVGVNAVLRDPATGVRQPVMDVRTRVWFNPELQSRKFLIPGIVAMLLMLVTILLTSLSIVREKEAGTLEQLYVTPIRPHELIIGKLAPFFLIGFLELTILTLEAWLVFGVGLAGSVVLYYLFSSVFILTTLGIGFLVSTVSKNQQQAMMSSIFFFILPMVLLGGFVFPINNMPPVIQAVTYALPLRYFFVIIRGLFLKGVGVIELWDELAALLLIAAVLYGVAIVRFRKRLD